MGIIPTLTFEEIADGWNHQGMLNNDPLYLNTLIANMPFESIPVSNPLICPIVIEPEPIIPESTCELQVVVQEVRKSRSKKKKKGKRRRKGSSSGSSRRRELSSSSSKSKSKKSSKSKSKSKKKSKKKSRRNSKKKQ